jgi:hypothetical protein
MESRHPRWQFRLRHLFAVTTTAAIGSAFVASFGSGAVITLIGSIVACLNLLGMLAPLQRGRPQAVVLGLAWIAFLASLALPSVTILGPAYGYGLAWFSIIAPIQTVIHNEIEPEAVPYGLMGCANVLMALMPLLVWRLAIGRGQRWCTALCLVIVAPWVAGWGAGLLVGYYVWGASFILALVAIPLRKHIAIAMVVEGIALGIFRSQ